MASTLTKILLHVIFSTKHREDLIMPSVEPGLDARTFLRKYGIEWDERYIWE